MYSTKIRTILLANRSLDSITKRWIQQQSVKPSVAYINSLDAMVKGSRRDGDILQMDRLGIMATENQTQAVISVVNPTSTALTEISGIAWAANQGYTGDAVADCLNTNFIPSSSGVNYTTSSASMGIYTRTEVAGAYVDMGCVDTASSPINATSIIWSRFTGTNLMYFNLNSNNGVGAGSFTNSPSIGMNSVGTVAGTMTGYHNGASGGTSANTNYSLSTRSIYLLANNSTGVITSFSARQLSMYWIGGGGVNHQRWYNRFQLFAVDIGFNV